MRFLAMLSLVFQALMVIHIMKTGRHQRWIWVVIILPFIGGLAYLVIEVAPEFLRSYKGQKATAAVVETLNPNGRIQEARASIEATETLENQLELGQALMARGQMHEAREVFQNALTGINRDDPQTLLWLAQTEFELAEYEDALATLESLATSNPRYDNPELPYWTARCHDQLGHSTEALDGYQSVMHRIPGPEPAYHCALLHLARGDAAEGRRMLEQIVKDAGGSGRHHLKLYRQWIQRAKSELASLS